MRGLQVRSFLKRANDFLSGMKLFADAQDDRFKYSAVLLAVHSAISYGDALCVGLGATEGGRRNHKDRVPELRKLLSKRRHKSQQGIKHFEDLLREKTDVAYSSKTITENQAAAIVDHAQKFSVWANRTGIELQIEGWHDAESN